MVVTIASFLFLNIRTDQFTHSKFLLLVLGHQALSIYQNRDFITVYHGEQEGPNDFDTVLLKALVGGINEL